mgnify:CR=1 FL=1
MNNLLELKGEFQHSKNISGRGGVSFKKNEFVKAEHLFELADELEKINSYWKKNTELDGALLSAHYDRVIPKSNRLQFLFSIGEKKPNDFIVGAKFEERNDKPGLKCHVFTYFLQLKVLKKAIGLLKATAELIQSEYEGVVDYNKFESIKKNFRSKKIHKTTFLKVLVDGLHVAFFQIDRVEKRVQENTLITIYKTTNNITTRQLLARFGINIPEKRIMDELTIQMRPEEVQMLLDKAPYLVAMSVNDLTTYVPEETSQLSDQDEEIIPHPRNEPIIGVIDTPFREDVYFHEWVEYINCIHEDITIEDKDYDHGTEVTSIIVDGPRGNPQYNDGCGNFRVRHFGVAPSSGVSSFSVIQTIRKIVSSNKDIKVWNLSLGSALEINENFISPEAAELDKLQNEFGVIFVIAGTNLPSRQDGNQNYRIGAPADSLNGIVVNAVNNEKRSASYSRTGPVLSFFRKPDFSYYGGDKKDREYMTVCKDNMGQAYNTGTSFAAPWVTRKVAYLIYVMGMSREVAKALLIDAAAGWNCKNDNKMGYGILPISIQDILKSTDDEIKFVIYGITENYCTYNYSLPVPIKDDKFPYLARATLVYFPECNRNQGVDYTNTELDFHFGRFQVNRKNNHPKINSINGNLQDEKGGQGLFEADARREYRKWDNVKFISDKIKPKVKPRVAYESGMWGIQINCKNRLSSSVKSGIPFGLVVTLKEIKGVNRYDIFKQMCQAKGWLVNEVSIENRIDIYLKGEENILLE